MSGVYTIPAGVSFVDALAAGIVSASGKTPEELTDVEVLLPTRRACRALGEAFLRLNEGKPMLLPRMTPLGDIDEDELALTGGLDEMPGGLDIPPAVPGLRRQLLLARLVMAFEGVDAAPDQACRLAAELSRFLDQAHTERLSFARLAKLVPDELKELADHWRITLKFLKIITEQWPLLLDEEGCLDPAERRNRLLEARAGVWLRNPPSHPVVAAGSTGSIPATADLLKVVAGLPSGKLVLPGLDVNMDDLSWRTLGPSHPQFGMARLLEHLGVGRGDVTDWPAFDKIGVAPGRSRLINSALSSPETTGEVVAATITPADIDGIIRINAPDPQAEAGAIALMMRHGLETPGRTSALVTPDRSLARRVAEELRRWNIHIDDSAGRPLAETPPGAFLRLTAEMAAEDLAPVALLSVLKHPLAGGGWSEPDFRVWARKLEKHLLRGPRPGPGVAGLRAAVAATRHNALSRGRDKTAEDLDALSPGLDVLEQAVKPFARLMDEGSTSPGDLLKAHIAFSETLAATAEETGAERLWRGADGEAAAGFIAELGENIGVFCVGMDGRRYPAFFDSLMAGRVVRPAFGSHPRLYIWGNLEARLQHADVMILGGLNEDTWPPEARPSPWMSRSMQKDFGLPAPERRIGLSAHDFVQGISASRVVLTRAERIGGAPTVPSRWLQRIDNLLEGAGLAHALEPSDDWLGWARGLDDHGGPPTPVGQPKFSPPLSARPRELPTTEIEKLIRDPYAVYARRILRLRPLEPIDADPDAGQRGNVIHEILDKFVRAWPNEMPDDAEDRLISIGREVFARLMAWPIVRALWWPRFERVAHWFVGWERERRASGVKTEGTEVEGDIILDLAGGPFTLKARADRIDRLKDGTLAVIDYKTGSNPSGAQMESGLAPQLPLEALIAEAGGFKAIGKADVSELVYVLVSGGREPGKTARPKLESGVRNLIDKSRAGLVRLLGCYDMEKTPYLSRVRVQYERHEGDYDHLARVKEWGLGDGGEQE
ncbi:MAG: double-strand break repair protein AddB [Rhodospirillales bacterium RIFCSPLOWO2_12_FULL_58_28]|nr:MAG: double-strand break repair protein AddB [Rhodospirillales bacterium RIFCSPLOWO2_02_FULL_58_16]OHC78214.1 MAG: double-strand break repair protein AddB [Rhodospirillales bacterium RIFCSPLOWO2_12_FULL_58_28]